MGQCQERTAPSNFMEVLPMSKKASHPHHRNLPLLLLQAREHVIAHFRPILNAHGITEQQWRIVRVLLTTEPLEPREIGELCSLSSPSLAGVLARMEELGFVTRRRFDDDRRRVHVSLTPRSRSLAKLMAPQIDETYREIEDLLGPELWARLQRTLDDLVQVLTPSR